RSVRARIYRANGTNSAPTRVYYREDSFQLERGRFVLASAELPHPQTQPYIHDSIVKVVHRGKQYKFRVFFKRHKLLPTNQAILQLAGAPMDGDVLVVACGTKVGIRNIRGRLETRAADKAVKRFAQHIAPFRTRRTFPASVSL
ncbi:hypothetical protein F5879DRAFT_1067459, partial [Lentinula edodes]|uniref:uncharacterized protein n=1 Tax=Lentinula edodes TaxID=5353 RepID=UPI001E8E0261